MITHVTIVTTSLASCLIKITSLTECNNNRLNGSFGLVGTASVRLTGVGGCTVDKLRRFDLTVISSYKPDVVILEIGTNDLCTDAHEVVGSAIEDLVHLVFEYASVRVIGWCCVIPCAVSQTDSAFFHQRAIILNNYVRVVLELIPGGFLLGA